MSSWTATTDHEPIAIQASNVIVADLTRARPTTIRSTSPAIPLRSPARCCTICASSTPGEQAIKINPVGQGWADHGTIECSAIELTDAGRPFVRDSCYTGGIDAHAAWGWVVRSNRIDGIWRARRPRRARDPLLGRLRDTLVENNVIVDCARGIGFGLLATSGDRAYPDDPYPGVGYLGHIDGIIRNNFIAAADPDLFESDAGFDAGIALEQSRDTWVVHNSVVSTAAPFSSIEWRFANTLVHLVNNLVSHNLRERDGNPQEVVLAGNLAGAELGWFASVPLGDLHLVAAGLPPVDAGTAIAAGLADRDIDLAVRPAARDIGADEVASAPVRRQFRDRNFERLVGSRAMRGACPRIALRDRSIHRREEKERTFEIENARRRPTRLEPENECSEACKEFSGQSARP